MKANAAGQAATYSYDADSEVTQTSYSGNSSISTPTRSYSFDPDGRTTSVNISGLGTQLYGFDNDGRMTSATEPSGIAAAATLTYGYYADGSRSSVSVTPEAGSNLALTQSDLLQYAYRADKALAAETLTYGTTQYPFTWTYTAAGRETSQLDAYGSTYEQTRAYDTNNFGHLQTLTLGSTPFSQLTYDLEDELASGTEGGNAYGVLENVRGQAIETTDYSTNCPECTLESAPTANGMVIPYPGVAATAWDTRNGVITGSQVASGVLTTYSYDNAARQISTSAYKSQTIATCETTNETTNSSSYDAEDRMVGQGTITENSTSKFIMAKQACSTATTSASSQNVAYTWGAKHPVTWTDIVCQDTTSLTLNCNQTPEYATSFHWDNDDLLFSTGSTPSATGTVNRISMGSIADLVVNGSTATLDVYDRDLSGFATTYHNSSGYAAPGISWSSAWSLAPSQAPYGTTYARTDGVFIGSPLSSTQYGGLISMTFQGGRAYNPATQSWMTPDAYQGEIDNPLSQESFVWNGDNPYQYSDPSGYCPICAVVAVPVVEIGIGDVLIAVGAGAVGSAVATNGHQVLDGIGSILQAGADKLEPGPHAGDGVPLKNTNGRPTQGERDAVREEGDKNGCHSCGTKSFGTKSGNPVSDHQPPTALNPNQASQKLYPQCITCSAKQGPQVRQALPVDPVP
jgi:hypothetical protein